MNTRILKKIKDFCIKKYSVSKSRRHDVGHIERVRKNALAIVKALNLHTALDINLLQSACYLHDIALCEVSRGTVLSHLFIHVFEKSFIKRRIGPLVKRFHLPKEEEKILVTAIVNHPYSIPYHCLHKTGDIYSKILQDADSLDYVSQDRQAQFEKAHPSLSIIARLYLSFLRKNIRSFLNFPELKKLLLI